MTPLQKRIRETVQILENRIDDCKDCLSSIKRFCKHESCYVDMATKHGTFIPVRICVACDSEVGEPTSEQASECITRYADALGERKLVS